MSTVQLIVAASRFIVARDAGVELFERNARLQASGQVEVAEVPLHEPPGGTLRLVLGAQPLALIEPAPSIEHELDRYDPSRADAASREYIAEFFPDLTVET